MMRSFYGPARALFRKLGSNLRLLRHDPERFGRNLSQFTNAPLFEERLIDVIHATPMFVEYTANSQRPPTLNVLDASWTVPGMTGGPNTVINLACRIAQRGISVRLVATGAPADLDAAWFRRHAESLVGDHGFPEIEIASAADRQRPLQVGPQDVFLATHWRTAQQLREVLALLPVKQFFYMLQDFEPSFYPWSSNYALAIETFNLDFWPIINEMSLAEYILTQPFGRLCDPVMRERALVFEPAVDTRLFTPGQETGQHRPKRLLLYARPSNPRNMFGLALLALRRAVAHPVFDGWEFLSIGSRDSVPDLALGAGRILRRASWMDYLGYADLLRESDLLLCPMLSPHTSYPVLEMAACGGISITNSFATKTRAQLERLSANIISVEPTLEGFAEGLVRGAQRVNGGKPRSSSVDMPSSWGAALDPVALRVEAIIRGWVGNSDGKSGAERAEA